MSHRIIPSVKHCFPPPSRVLQGVPLPPPHGDASPIPSRVSTGHPARLLRGVNVTFPLLVALRTGASALDDRVIEEFRPKIELLGSFRPVSPEIEKTPSGLPDGKRVPTRSFRL